MENCTIYSHDLDFECAVQIVKTKLPKAKVEVRDGGKQKALIASIKGGFFGKSKTLKINYRERKNPSYKLDQVECGLSQNLAGMVNFIQSIPAENQELTNTFLHKVMAANCEMPFMAEPEMTQEFESVLKEILIAQDAFVFAQPSRLFSKSNGQHFLDNHLNLILDTNGKSEIEQIEVKVDAKYHDQPASGYNVEQLSRKANSESYLESQGVKVNKNLPCGPSMEALTLRKADEVVDRAYALLVTAAKGEGVAQEHLAQMIEKKSIASLSPKEKEVYHAESLSDQDRAYATWRYEGLNTLLWSLGKVDTLSHPSDICDVKQIVAAILQPSRADFEASVSLRTSTEILDELDKIYRMNWACVDARLKGEEAAGNIHPGVVYERHYALNWLTNYQNQDWDDVQTNT